MAYKGITTNGHQYLVDHADVELINQYTWTKPKDGYIKKYLEKNIDGKRYRKVIFQHRLIVNAKEDEIVDHINGDTTDNRRENLRITTKSVNALNSYKSKGKVPHRGVFFNNSVGKYTSRIRFNKKTKHLGFFADPVQASKAYRKAQKEILNNV